MKRIASFLVLCLLAVCLAVPALASDNVRTGNAVGSGANDYSTHSPASSIEDTVNSVTNELIDTNVTTGDIVNKLNSKGTDIVRILQTVGKYVCIGGFIVCCILTLLGIIGNKRMLAGGIIGLIISGVAYAGIVCGPEIVNWIAAWAAS